MTELTVTQAYFVGAPIVLGMIFFEAFISSWHSKDLYRKEDTLCTMGLLVGNIIMVFAIKGATLAFHFYLYQFRAFNFSDFMPAWAIWTMAFVLIDFVFYFFHRLSHRTRFLWAIHMSHHSSEEMNFAVSFRQAWFGPISKLPFFMVLPLVGLEPTVIAVAGVISTLWGIVGHTQIIGRLGPIEWVFNTPSHHRVHHGANEEYVDKNYGNLLIVWDRLFGTFEPERNLVKFGLVKNVKTFNPVKITFMAWQEINKDIRNAQSFKEAIHCFFGPPQTKGQV